MGFAITAFSARLVTHLKSLGAIFTDQEQESFIAIWRYCGHLMGVPGTILYRAEDDALKLFEVGRVCEPTPGVEAASMANSLVNSAPLIIGIDDPSARRGLAKYVFNVSRALIGSGLADDLRYPTGSSFGVLGWFRLQSKYQRILDRVIPSGMRNSNFANFTSLLEASAFDEEGISYRMPDHAHAEESTHY